MVASDSVSHVIFDYDGLLVDTEPLYTKANQMMLGRFGIDFTMDLKRRMMGKKHNESIRWLLEEVGICDKITPEEYARDYDAWLDEAYLTAPALHGARRLVEHLVKHNVPVAICTGSCSRTFALKNSSHREWTDLIPIKICTGDDPNVAHGKPHPEPYLYTMSKFEKQPESASSVLVFEDAPNGVESALAAGMKCVMVPDPNVFTPDDNYRSRLNLILTNLEEFKPELFGLPPF